MVLNNLHFCKTTLSTLLCDQFIMTGSSLDMKLFTQPFLPAEAAGGIFFLDASNGLYRPLPIIQIC